MSTKKERIAKYLEDIDGYIKHQMCNRTEAEKQTFRTKQIAMYNDATEKYAEKLKQALYDTIK